ncbi:MAG: hypothetical protein II715_05460, partial [Clostridia bacterium]|nr:hypothetical protein [Clostridia bacterium]
GLPRKGKIRVTTKQLFTEDQLKSMDVSEIRDRLAEELLHDEEQAMAGVPYRCKDTTEGLSKILYTCPSCLSEDTIVSGENRVRCVKCGMTAQLDETYRLTGCRFRSINEWVDWQSSRIDTESFRIDTPVILDAVNEKGNMVHEAGQGRLVYDRNVFELHGTLFGVPLDFSVKSEKIPAFPVTPGHHFDIYDRGHLLNIVPQNPSDVIRIASFCDRLREENEKAVRGETVS